MASKRNIRRKSCERKKRYASKKKAGDATYSMIRTGTYDRQCAYKCKFCGGWHNGRRKKNKRRKGRAGVRM